MPSELRGPENTATPTDRFDPWSVPTIGAAVRAALAELTRTPSSDFAPLPDWMRLPVSVAPGLWRPHLLLAAPPEGEPIKPPAEKDAVPVRHRDIPTLFAEASKQFAALPNAVAFRLVGPVSTATDLLMGRMAVADFVAHVPANTRVVLTAAKKTAKDPQMLTLDLHTPDKLGTPVTVGFIDTDYTVLGLRVHLITKGGEQHYKVEARYRDLSTPDKKKVVANITSYFVVMLNSTDNMAHLREPFAAGDPQFLPKYGEYLARQWAKAKAISKSQ